MGKKKILYIVSTLKSSGPINVLFNIIKYLNRESFEPFILTLSPEPQKSSLSRFQKLGVRIHSLNLSRVQGFLIGKIALMNFVEEYSPDVVHTHGIRADMFSAQCLKPYKRVSTIHNYPNEDYSMTYGKLLGWYMTRRHLQVFKKIDFLVGVSESVAKSKQFRGRYIHAIRNGVDLDFYSPVAREERLALRQKLGLLENQKIFVSVGHLSMRKNPQTVLRGFLASKAKNDGLLLFLGDGPLRKQCEKISQGQGCVVFTGKVSNVADYLKAADYLISASLSEGIGYAVLEALACGVPVCLSDIKPFREIISLNEKVGLLFPASNSAILAAKINKIIADNDNKSRSKAGVEMVSKYFNARKMSENYQNLYKKAIETRKQFDINCIQVN